jgi:hypothetical protein
MKQSGMRQFGEKSMWWQLWSLAHYVNSSAFFTPLSIAPKQLSSPELEQILKDIPAGKTNFTTKF